MGERDLLSKLDELIHDIYSEFGHGECFFEEDMFNDFIKLLDKTKEVAKQYFEENQKEKLVMDREDIEQIAKEIEKHLK